MSKSTKPVKKTRSLDERETDLKQRLLKITLLREIRTKRDELNKLKTKK